MENTIKLDMTIAEIFSKFPTKSQRLAHAMTNAGLHCTSCSAATWETLEAGMLSHGMAKDSMTKLLVQLNEILAEKLNLSTISLSPRAAEKFRQFAKEEGIEHPALRFGDTAGGCGGFQYILDFCEKSDADDETFESEGIKIYVKKAALGRLIGATIEYVDGLQGAGFKISNPNVKSSCGCGTSQDY